MPQQMRICQNSDDIKINDEGDRMKPFLELRVTYTPDERTEHVFKATFDNEDASYINQFMSDIRLILQGLTWSDDLISEAFKKESEK